jgi:Tol biopolymer transport system component
MKPRTFVLLAALIVLALAGAVRAEPPPRHGNANKDVREAAVSTDGRFVAFASYASDIVLGDTNYAQDVFLYDRDTGQTMLISRRADGVQGNGDSYSPSLSADGRYVAFQTEASNLNEGPAGGGLLVLDRQTGEFSAVARSSDGDPANDYATGLVISADGHTVAFYTAADNLVEGDTQLCDNGKWNCRDVFVHDLLTGETALVSRNANGVGGDDDSWTPSLSADGRYVAFASAADNLLEGNPDSPPISGDMDRIYVHDRQTGQTTLASVNSDGAPASSNSVSASPSISGDGQLVAFLSSDLNLTPDDSDSTGIYVHNRVTGQTILVSRSTAGAPGNATSWKPVISSDGSAVAFGSAATNLVADDNNGVEDIFVHDLATGQTALASRRQSGAPGDGDSWSPAISGDGQVIAFETYATNLGDGGLADGLLDVAVHDRATGETVYLTARPPTLQGNSESRSSAVSAGGRFVAFESYASNLVPGDTNGRWDIFVRDMQTGQTALIGRGAQATGESRNPAISADGRFVAFESTAEAGGSLNSNSNVFVHDRQTGATALISRPMNGLAPAEGASRNPSLSADGRYVVFDSSAANLVAGDANQDTDIFVYDSQTGAMTRIPRSPAGDSDWVFPCCAVISADGRYVAFAADVLYSSQPGWPVQDYIRQVFVHDRATGETVMVSFGADQPANDTASGAPSISADGRTVAFHSGADDLVAGDTNSTYDIFVYDLNTGQRTLISRHTAGALGNAGSRNPTLSPDGRYVAFQSDADNLVDDDDNDLPDVFIHDRQAGQTTLVSRDGSGAPGRGHSFEPAIAAGGAHVAFWSDADLVTGDVNGLFDVFLFDRAAERAWLVSGLILGPHQAFAPAVAR